MKSISLKAVPHHVTPSLQKGHNLAPVPLYIVYPHTLYEYATAISNPTVNQKLYKRFCLFWHNRDVFCGEQ